MPRSRAPLRPTRRPVEHGSFSADSGEGRVPCPGAPVSAPGVTDSRRSPELGGIPHLQVHPVRTSCTAGCASCVGAAPAGARPHPSDGSGEPLHLERRFDRCIGPWTTGSGNSSRFRCQRARSIGRKVTGQAFPGQSDRYIGTWSDGSSPEPRDAWHSAPVVTPGTHELHGRVRFLRG
jgi:hypothetical protein